MTRVLITGAAGFIGSNMVQYLLKDSDYTIYGNGIDNFRSGFRNKELIKKIEGDMKKTHSDITKIKLLGLDPVVPVKEGIFLTYQWYKSQ